ncbi:class I SAM-dependent methyltransferase [Clostridium sp. AWRP]|uniref:class I SAM-dependent methyltransferase n=1 Tax=Clostridium sp. AWRP TaxID=2212991 RepID=UPI000FDC02F9|nr:class I SAM-dependent methyltransferase [Clostridium sp. AWRP]AZV56630.1 methyltransferase domain-containing protein [Clostridium sp. AWRP]
MNLGYENPSLLYSLIDEFGNNRLFSSMYKNYIKTLKLKGNEKVLDFGSGSGAGSRHLAKILKQCGGHLTCVDISEYWTEKAKKRMKYYNNVSFLVGQLSELKLGSESFDVIYVFYTLHDVLKNLRNSIVSEFFRILKNNGRLYIKEPQRENDGMPISEIIELMESNGFYEESSISSKCTYSAVYRKKC